MEGKVAPVRVGETYDVSIEAVGSKGDGIAKVRGFVLFVPGVKKGENVKIKITKVLANSGFAEVLGPGEAPVSVRRKKFETVTKEELEKVDDTPKQHYEDTEDFGEEK